ARRGSKASECEVQPCRAGEQRREESGETVRWDDVEPGARKDRDPGALRVLLLREERLEDGHLAGDVEVGGARCEAGLQRRRARPRERAGREEKGGRGFERARRGASIGEVEPPKPPSLLRGERLDDLPPPAGDRQRNSCGKRGVEDEPPRVPVCAVEEERRFHRAGAGSSWRNAARVRANSAGTSSWGRCPTSGNAT